MSMHVVVGNNITDTWRGGIGERERERMWEYDRIIIRCVFLRGRVTVRG
jgi:hypothetical protein